MYKKKVDKGIKKRLIITVIIATLGELSLFFYIAETHPLWLNWQVIVSSLLLLAGILLTFNLIPLRKTLFKDKNLIFYAIIINPGLVQIFAGVTGLTMQNSQLEYVSFASGIIMVLGIITGFVMLIAALIRS
jgi:hypothetical protein